MRGLTGNDYAVHGSPAIDVIAYTRVDRNTISGMEKKNGHLSFTEVVKTDPGKGPLTMSYSIHVGGQIVASGVAVFEKDR